MTAIHLHNVSKSYALYKSDLDRMLEVLTKRDRHRTVHALHPMSLRVPKGQVVGIIGRNGAGKSTLLKIISTTLATSTGKVMIGGRMSALLELGTGFHPDMSGRESVYLSGAIMGVSRARMESLYEEIVDFSGVRDFMDQPVKTYSSGMRVRLAFAVATSVEPDILIIDEHLSVGDGAFSRKSFQRIKAFKDAGKTILFCSHSMYQIEAICSRAIWLDRGYLRMDGKPSDVVAAYTHFLGLDEEQQEDSGSASAIGGRSPEPVSISPKGTARICSVIASVDGASGRELSLNTGESDLELLIQFEADPDLPVPSVAVQFFSMDGRVISSAGSHNDSVELVPDPAGRVTVALTFPGLSLLKGSYWVNAFLLCEDGIHIYDAAKGVVEINVIQDGLEQGLVHLPHNWRQVPAESSVERVTVA